MDTYVISAPRRLAIGGGVGNGRGPVDRGGERTPDEVRWIRRYVLAEPAGGGLGTVCIYQASSPEAIRRHAAAADLPVDEIVHVADTGRELTSHETRGAS